MNSTADLEEKLSTANDVIDGDKNSAQDRRQNISLKNLYLDPNNYRFIDAENYTEIIEDSDFLREDVQRRTVSLILGRGAENVRDLIDSFRKSGFLAVDQIQVKQLGNGKYLVIEGNRRVACLKYLQGKFDTESWDLGKLDPTIFQRVPVVYYQGADEAHHLILMGLKHISGNKKWPAINQAELVRDLHIKHKMTPEEICHSISIKRQEFNTVVSTLKLIDLYKEGNFSDQFKSEMYSIFREIIRNAEIKAWLCWDDKLGMAGAADNLERLFSWISEDEVLSDDANEDEEIGASRKLEPVLTKATHIREFASLVRDENALANLDSTRSLIKASLSSEILSKDKVKNSIGLIGQEINSVFSMMSHLGNRERLDLSEATKKLQLMLDAGGDLSVSETAQAFIVSNTQGKFSSIGINSYKRFNDVKLNDLRRINIFAGLNNCGKTSLLEAVEILVNLNSFRSLIDIFARRAKCRPTELSSDWVYRQLSNYSLEAKFDDGELTVSSSKEIIAGEDQAFYIGSIDTKCVYLSKDYSSTTSIFERYPYKTAGNAKSLTRNKFSSPYSVSQLDAFVLSYDAAVDSGLKVDVVEFIRENIDTSFRDIELVKDRFVVTTHDGVNFRRSDLSSFGDGMQRVFNICTLFASAKNGIVMLDEAESGIHKSLMNKFAGFIYKLSNTFNVQVFLTTHSKECIDAFVEQDEVPNSEIAGFALVPEGGVTSAIRVSGERLHALNESIDFDLRGN